MGASFVLPYPPSVNRYYRHVGAKVLISREGRAYRDKVVSELRLMRVDRMEGDVRMNIFVCPPDRRRRDIDNVLKALLDAIVHGGAIGDDSQVKRLFVEMMDPIGADARALVEIEEIQHGREQKRG